MPQESTEGHGVPRHSRVTLLAGEELLEHLRHATVGEYDVAGEIGQGGMASVYLAHDLALDRKVAIKLMSPALVHGPGMVERFKREARTAAALSHPNIIPVYAVRQAEGLLFFVMKLVQGTPLDTILKESGSLPIPMIEAILAQVGSAFGYAHRQGVVHRDIKPGNIMIDDEGWAVVTDFGIAKVTEADGLTLTGMAVGTPTYMSPEQCAGGDITGASDQYSLGVVAYEMLVGRPPFTEPTVMGMMFAHATREPPPLAEARADCPEQVRGVVERMLAKNPADRWPSMEEAVAAIGASTLSHDDPTRTRMIELARTGLVRRPLAQVRTPSSPIPHSRERPVPAVEAPRRKREGWLVTLGVLAGVAVTATAAMVALRGRTQTPPEDAGEVLVVGADSAGTATPPEGGSGAAPVGSSGAATAGGLTGAGQGSAARGPVEPRPANPPNPPRQPTPGEAARPATAPPPPPPAAPPSAPVDTVSRVAPPPVVAPAPPPPPPPPPAVSAAAESVARAADARAAVEATVAAYARALETGRLADAVRLFPAMPADQRQGLEAFYREGGTMDTRWSIRDLVVSGEAATLRLEGTTLVRTTRSGASEQRVNLRARLVRGSDGWRFTALVN